MARKPSSRLLLLGATSQRPHSHPIHMRAVLRASAATGKPLAAYAYPHVTPLPSVRPSFEGGLPPHNSARVETERAPNESSRAIRDAETWTDRGGWR